MLEDSIRLRQGSQSVIHPIILHPANTTGFEPDVRQAVVETLNAVQAWYVLVTGTGFSFGPLAEKLAPALIPGPEPEAFLARDFLWNYYGWAPGRNVCHLVFLRGGGGYAGYIGFQPEGAHLIIVGDAFIEAALGHQEEAARIMKIGSDWPRAQITGARRTLMHELGHLVGMGDEHDNTIDTLMGAGMDRTETRLTGPELLICQGSKWLS